MLNLPRGVPVYENVQAAQYEGPAILKLLTDTRLSGYAKFTFLEESAHLLFTEGDLIFLTVGSKNTELTGLEAISRLFELVATEGGRLDVYRLSTGLTRLVLGFLRGTRIHEAQALKLLDRKALLDGIRLQKLEGVLHIYTADRCSMIFYHDGIPLGFFHDGCEDLATSATEFQNVAAMPDAMVDVTKISPVVSESLSNILEMINVEKVWQVCISRHAAKKEAVNLEFAQRQQAAREAAAVSLEESVFEITARFLGKIGRTLAEKEIAARGGRSALLDSTAAESFLLGIEKGSRLLTSASKTKEMLDALRSELNGRARTPSLQ